MFSQACVKNSVHSEVYTLLGRHPPSADTPSWADPPPQQTPQVDGYCSRRYSSYWNAFLSTFRFVVNCGPNLIKLENEDWKIS